MLGFLGEVFIKAYGATAAFSVAVSDAETLKGKAHDAVAAIPNLMDRYRDAQYVVDHRDEIQTAIDYVNQHAPDRDRLMASANKTSETLDEINKTFDELGRAKASISDIRFGNAWETSKDAAGHLRLAWDARPDLDSINQLGEVAAQVSPFAKQVEVLIPAFYGGVLTVVDNFAGDEIVATLGVMAAAIGIAWLLGTGMGFWARRGRPGLIARALQRLGARVFRDWYVNNPGYALSRPLHAAARERIQRDIVTDPEQVLDPDALRRLELYFERRSSDNRLVSSTSARPRGSRR